MTSNLFRTARPFWVKINADGHTIDLHANPIEPDSQAKFKTADLKFECEPNKFCTLTQFKEKFGQEELI